jgi:hypothetical protein
MTPHEDRINRRNSYSTPYNDLSRDDLKIQAHTRRHGGLSMFNLGMEIERKDLPRTHSMVLRSKERVR